MRRWIVVTVLAASLGGCSHYFTLTRADFDRGKASRVVFARDNYKCQIDATVTQNQVGGGDSIGIYNDAYVACMRGHGYQTSDIDFLGLGG